MDFSSGDLNPPLLSKMIALVKCPHTSKAEEQFLHDKAKMENNGNSKEKKKTE